MVPTICLLNIMTRRRLLLCVYGYSRFSPDILSLVFIVQISADRKWIELMAISDNFINRQITDAYFVIVLRLSVDVISNYNT